MKVKARFLERLHLDNRYFLLTGRAVQTVRQVFDLLDTRGINMLDDVQFLAFMNHATDLPESKTLRVFDTLDVDHSGSIEFDEFYLLVCMLIATKDGCEKQFLWRHSRTCFELLDEDGSEAISIEEFDTFGFIFNITQSASKEIFAEFDVDGSEELDYDEFRMFSLACIDRQKQIEQRRQQQSCIIL